MKTFVSSIRFMIVMTVLTGFIYPVAMTGISQMFFSKKVNGSLVKNQIDVIVGSELIAQKFTQEKYFWPRPSATDYNPMPSGGTNLSPISLDLLTKVSERKALGNTEVLLYASGSALDPHISPNSADNQVLRVAKARSVNEALVRDIVTQNIESRQFGFLGEERVNVLKLNLALDVHEKKKMER